MTAASLFDGHDAAINIMRRIMQSCGAEVIHLGHNRSVSEIVTAALQEDVHGIAVSSYQGGHLEYFKYMIDLLKANNASHIKVFGGGGGVITLEEIKILHDYGVTRIYTPEDGQQLGLKGMIMDMLARADSNLCAQMPKDLKEINQNNCAALARIITGIENAKINNELLEQIRLESKKYTNIPVLGITGTGGSGKSSLTDELIRRFRHDKDDIRIAIIALDPTKQKSGGALLGDRIRMNAIHNGQIYMRSLATRSATNELSHSLSDIVVLCKCAGFSLVIIETPGIGQGDKSIVPFVDYSLYVMTPEFGASSQLEKIDMLDYADVVAINKFDRKGAQDALHDVRKQVQRNREAFGEPAENMPVYGTFASRFNDEGTTALYQYLLTLFNSKQDANWVTRFKPLLSKITNTEATIIPPERQRYLGEILKTVRDYKSNVKHQAKNARTLQQLRAVRDLLIEKHLSVNEIESMIEEYKSILSSEAQKLLDEWPEMLKKYQADEFVFQIRDREIRTPLAEQSLSGTRINKISLPKYVDQGEILAWRMLENCPGLFPFTAGVFPFKRAEEDPGRMFAGEGDPFRTNKRFKFLSEHSDAKRLSTAFDSVTLYGFDPDLRPDIYGKIGNSGVSVATLDDMKVLFDGFDLVDSKTSVSMTINGPAPTILAMFLNTAIDQQVEKFKKENQREPTADEFEQIKSYALHHVRGTVQADILKEDQGQNTCIFSTEFSLRLMGDVQDYFIKHKIRNFYSISISGYHIAEAGANPITQLAFTLANGFTYVESYLARGMNIDDFSPNFSFFFSNGMDPEYSVIGRVARRIWAIVMREKYHANERSQKLKYHVQTSGRSLHAQEMAFNDIRTTLEALIAIYDNCNSLHTNAYDEALTTPTTESVRRAMAIQLIINKEWGLAKNENPNQGSFIIEELTELVEEAVLAEFNRLNERGGVLGAMETGYQRSKIQDESMLYEIRKHDGSLPLIGVNTFVDPDMSESRKTKELARSTEEEKQSQISRLQAFHERNKKESSSMIAELKKSAMEYDNIFKVLMDAVRVCSLGEITQALFEVGGQYRRNM